MSDRQPDALFRLYLLRLITVVIFATLGVRLAALQFRSGAQYQERAIFNRVREVRPEGERGVIYDRDGRILARNIAAYAVALTPADLPDDPDYAASQAKRMAVYEALTALIEQGMAEFAAQPRATPIALPAGVDSEFIAGHHEPPPTTLLTVAEIDTLVLRRELGSAFQPVLVAQNLPREVALRVEEERYRFPGVSILLQPRRQYAAGADTAHILGYMGPIPAEASKSYRERGYNADAWVGWTGLEMTFEELLRGQLGRRVIEVDVNGREQAVIGEPIAAQPGQNLILSLDLELQQAMREALLAGVNPLRSHSAAAVAIDPRTGFILGMVSLPTYDNNIFADGVTDGEYADITSKPGKALLNHAISGIYPPGSVFKLVPAAAGLQEEVITSRTLLNAPGIIYLPNRFFPDNPALAQPFVCWVYKLGGYHGDITVREALAHSCDIFFYKLGGGWYANEFEGLGIETLAAYARLFGYGETSGIDLPAENPGLVPDTRWKRIAKGERWVTGDTYNLSIGQGDLLATPLQVTMMTAAVANDGAVYRPQLVAAITDAESRLLAVRQPELIRQVPVEPKHLAVTREGMWMVVNAAGGTALNAALLDVAIAGKTGTAEFYDPEFPRDGRGNLPTHAWFTAFAPYDAPEIALTVFVYNGGEGSERAAPIAREILRSYFDIQARDLAAGSHSLLQQVQEAGP